MTVCSTAALPGKLVWAETLVLCVERSHGQSVKYKLGNQ